MLVGATLGVSGTIDVGAALVAASGVGVLAPPRPAPTLNPNKLPGAAEVAAAAAGAGVEDYNISVRGLGTLDQNLQSQQQQQQLEEVRD